MNDLINNTINLFLKEPVFLIIIILGIFSSIFYKKYVVLWENFG